MNNVLFFLADANQMIISYGLKPIDDFDQTRLTNIVVVDHLTSNVDKEKEIKDIFESWAKPDDEFPILNELPKLNKMNDSISLKNNINNNEIIVNTIVFNGKDKMENNRQLKQTDSLSSNDKRSQMLARMALDLQKHRNESSLSRSDSNQSHNSFGKKAMLEDSSFRDRLIKEAFEDDSVDCFSHKNTSLMKFQMRNGFESDNESQSSNTSDSEEEEEENNSIQEDDNDHSDASTDSSNTSDCDEDEGKFSNQTNKKPFAKLFKTGFINANKKYTKIVKKNLSKTSKFIVHTTQQLRNDTSDIVRKLKCDKKTTDLFEFGEKGSQKFKHKWTLGDDESEKSNAVRTFKMNFDMKKLKSNDEIDNENGNFLSEQQSNGDGKSIEPTLVKIKRLESTKLFETLDNLDATPPIPQRLKTSKEKKVENAELEPPKAPIRRKKIIRKTEALTLSRVKSDLEKFYNVFDEKTTTLNNAVIIENVKPLFKDYRLYNCAIKLSDNKVNLLVSYII